MSFEGFVNIIFHAFVKQDLKDRELNLEQRLDLEQKLRLMPSLCNCFDESAPFSQDVYDKFKKLKRYRNSLFHSKIEDSLKTLFFVEQGFLYNYSVDIDDQREQFLPAEKSRLTKDHVYTVKNFVDDIVKSTFSCMKDNLRSVAQKYILQEEVIPFFVSDNGDLLMTTESKEAHN